MLMPTMQTHTPLFTEGFLAGAFKGEYQQYQANEDATLLARLRKWAAREAQKETRDEHTFIGTFFEQTWGYVANGAAQVDEGHQLSPQHPVPRAGQGGGMGAADLAIGYFGRSGVAATPQVLCEFKDIRSGLDAPQSRKGNTRSPIKQCADYLKETRAELIGNEPIQPQWGLVTDMNEFRLYFWGRMPAQCQRFVITPRKGDGSTALTGDDDRACFQRFMFWRLLRADLLLSIGGASRLQQMLGAQGQHEKALEAGFYRHYRAFREALYTALVAYNPGKGTRGELVRLSQRIVDRLIFVLYCEDMGKALDFPQHLLRDTLKEQAALSSYSPSSNAIWTQINELFTAMANGTPFGEQRINYFNGGLFAPDPVLDGLKLPNIVFCTKGQHEAIDSAPSTLLYLSATYNFGIAGDGKSSITLLTLGRIFEQSITELEIRAAEEDGLLSIGGLSKRKRDGVYYTPEWVTAYIVAETIGQRLNHIKQALDWDEAALPDLDDGKKLRKGDALSHYCRKLAAYRAQLETLRVLDPACGSGAFLIQALQFLLAEHQRVTDLHNQVNPQQELFDPDQCTRQILARNIYGVDLNPESVEITKLALWLHTAVPGAPLTTLDANIRCGNSLVGPEFYSWRSDLLTGLTVDAKERINAFDWPASFPEVFKAGGFDCIVGNPPYVKLQNFRKVDNHAASFLVEGRSSASEPVYFSTQTGNFDLYLPFIEKGLALLAPQGRMGYIAPSVWLKNEYGEGLRQRIQQTGQLESWVDFASYMVFDEAIVYCALQFFTQASNKALRFAYAPDGALSDSLPHRMPYTELPSADAAWNLLPPEERALMAKLYAKAKTLEEVAGGIVVGIQTSADDIYHLTRIGHHRYRSKAGEEVSLEDALMKPLVSGPEAERYATPVTDTYLLFPYQVTPQASGGADTALYTAAEMAQQFPLGWAYFKRNEKILRARESRKMDVDDGWWAYNYPKNLDKQHLRKLIVPRLVSQLYCAVDDHGAFCLDNVDAGGIVVASAEQAAFIAGLLNSPVLNWAFLRISKPFQNGYYSANKQFIAPLPIPTLKVAAQKAIAAQAQQLQTLHTRARDLTTQLEKRLAACQWQAHKLATLWPAVPSAETLKAQASKRLTAREATAWAKAEHQLQVDALRTALLAKLSTAPSLLVRDADGELSLLAGGEPLLHSIFYSASSEPLKPAWWRAQVRNGKSPQALVKALLKTPSADNPALTEQIQQLDTTLETLHAEIAAAEHTINTAVIAAFGLGEAEQQMIANDVRKGWK